MIFPAGRRTWRNWSPENASSAIVGGLLTALLFLTSWLGEKKPGVEKNRPYECGVIPTGWARFRYPVPFYLVAVFFLIFDVEAAFVFSWAVAMKDLSWRGWLQITYFIVVLLLSLFYIWSKGGLDWSAVPPTCRKIPKA